MQINFKTRNPTRVMSAMKKVDNMYIAVEDVCVMFPERYLDREMAFIDNGEVKLAGIYAIGLDTGDYAVHTAIVMETLTPSDIVNYTHIDGDIYVCLIFEKDTVLMPDNTVPKLDVVSKDIFTEFYSKGNIPWFLNYNDIANLFRDAKSTSGSNMGEDFTTFEILASLLFRDSEDLTMPIRYSDGKIDYTTIGLNNIVYGYSSTDAKLVGGYFSAGITNAMVLPESAPTALGDALRR